MAVEITGERVEAAAARLRGDGWHYTARQLYYAVCADVETAPTRYAPGEVGLGVLLILVGAITGQRVLLAVLGLVGLVLVLLGTVTHVRERRPAPTTRLLAISYPDFVDRFLDGGRRELPGLVGRQAPGDPTRTATGDAVLVACDRDETAAMLAANSDRLPDGVAVLGSSRLGSDLGRRRVIALHDCDPAGCAMPGDLRDRGADVGDAGINPDEVAGRRLQVLEGAPARLRRDMSGELSAAAIDWLCSGRRLEAATETPEQLVQRVRAALRALS